MTRCFWLVAVSALLVLGCGDASEDEDNTDGCASNPCLNGGTCAASDAKAFTCECATGFSGETCEVETPDACAVNPCKNDGVCTAEADGTTRCRCAVGFSGSLCETAVAACADSPCLNGGLC